MNFNKSWQQMTTPPESTGAEDLILHFIQALDRLGQNTTPLVPLVQTPTLSTNQMCVQAPDTFDGMNLEDLQTFLLQCQITFKFCPQEGAGFPHQIMKGILCHQLPEESVIRMVQTRSA